MTFNNTNKAENISTLDAMCIQEEKGYLCSDYLRKEEIHFANACKQRLLSEQDIETSIQNRSKMVTWCYNVMDACGNDRETVDIAMSYFDRFMNTTIGQTMCLHDADTFQLACMTCLYIAIKIHEPAAMSPTSFSQLSNGFYTSNQIEQMEQQILHAIQWRVNPPTSLAFVRNLLNLIPRRYLNDLWKSQVYELTKIQIEMAINDYQFVPIKASSIAFASIVNACETLNIMDTQSLSKFILSEVSIDSKQVIQVQGLLYVAAVACTNNSTKFVPAPSSTTSCSTEHSDIIMSKPTRRSSHKISPRTVCL